MLFGRFFKKNAPHSSKNKLQHIQWSDTTGPSNGTGFCGQMKLKKRALLAANTFGAHKDKKYNLIYHWIFHVGGLFFCWRSWTSYSDTWHCVFYKISTDKKIKT